MSTVDLDKVLEPVTATELAIYTAPTAANFLSAKVTGGLSVNYSAVDTELTIWVVQQGGVTSTSNRYFPPKIVFAGQPDLLTTIAGSGITLKAGDSIVAVADVTDQINMKLSIVEKYSDT